MMLCVFSFPGLEELQLTIEQPVAHVRRTPVADVLRKKTEAREVNRRMEHGHGGEISRSQRSGFGIAFQEHLPESVVLVIRCHPLHQSQIEDPPSRTAEIEIEDRQAPVAPLVHVLRAEITMADPPIQSFGDEPRGTGFQPLGELLKVFPVVRTAREKRANGHQGRVNQYPRSSGVRDDAPVKSSDAAWMAAAAEPML